MVIWTPKSEYLNSSCACYWRGYSRYNMNVENYMYGYSITKLPTSEPKHKGQDRRWRARQLPARVAAQAQKLVARSNKLQLRAFAPSARATSYNRYIVYRRYLLCYHPLLAGPLASARCENKISWYFLQPWSLKFNPIFSSGAACVALGASLKTV